MAAAPQADLAPETGLTTEAQTLPDGGQPAQASEQPSELEQVKAALAKETQAREAAEAAAKKAENDRRAEQGRAAKLQREVAQRASEESERLRRLELRQEAYEKGIDPETHVAQGLTATRRQSFKTGAEAEANRVFAEAEALNLDPSTDDAFEAARDYLAEAADAPNEATYRRALNASRRAANQALAELRAKHAPANAPEPAPEKRVETPAEAMRARTKALEGIGGGTAAASVHVTKDNIDGLYMAGKVPGHVYRRFLETGEL